MEKHSPSRRDFVKKAAYAAPAILTLPAVASAAKSGSGNVDDDEKKKKKKKKKT